MSNELRTMADAPEPTNDTAEQVAVFVIDDHAGYRSLVGEVFAATAGFVVIGSAGSWAIAQDELRLLDRPPHLVLMDVNLGAESGVEASRELHQLWPDVKVILISTLDIDDLPADSHRCGASAFVPKSQLSPREILRAWHGAYDWKP